MSSLVEVIPVLHNVSSVQRVVDTARLVYALGAGTLVVTKAYGGAAQSGIAEATKIALKQGRSLIVLPELRDAINLLSPSQVILLTLDYAEAHVEPGELGIGPRTMIVASGSEPEFSPAELRLGRPVYFAGARGKLGAVAELALALYPLAARVAGQNGKA